MNEKLNGLEMRLKECVCVPRVMQTILYLLDFISTATAFIEKLYMNRFWVW